VNNLCLIIGAGASYDCIISDVVVSYEPGFKPPLTANIFSPSYDFLLKKYPKASTLAVEIRRALKNNPELSLEALLFKEQEKANVIRKKQIRQIPFFLRELFGLVSSRYVQAAQTCYAMLINQICDRAFDNILVINLNYDTLFESALQIISDIKFNTIDSYFNASQKWKVLKPHGSVNWIKRLVHDFPAITSPEPNLEEIDKLDDLKFDGAIQIAGINTHYLAHQGRDRCTYPCMVIPVEGKYDFCCPESHINESKELLKECNSFLIIGSSMKDKDVEQDLLRGNITKPLKKIGFVNQMDTNLEEYHLLKNKVVGLLGPYLLFNEGFSGFIDTEKSSQFLTEACR